MFDQNGLSLDQAPPISVVLRFFFVGALFGILGGVLMMIVGADVLNPASTFGRMMTHILTLGVMLSFMLGALFQMLPVVAGTVLQSPVRLASTVQYPFVLGTLALLVGFGTGHRIGYLLGAGLLTITLVPLVVMLLKRLLTIQNHGASSRGMMVALMALLVVVIAGFYLGGTLGGLWNGDKYLEVKTAHYSFGLWGWIALLIVAISFQSIEMFYVTPPHPTWMRSGLGWAVLILLGLSALGSVTWAPLSIVSHFLLLGLMATYGLITLFRLTQRKRPLSDATIWFWRTGLTSLVIATVALMAASMMPLPFLSQLSVLFFATFGISILFAMLYKIIPFLTWFHLNSEGYLMAPMMHEIIHPKMAKKHFYVHITTLILLAIGINIPCVIHFAGVGMTISFGWMLYHVVHAHRLYRHTQATGERFDLNPNP